MCDSDGIQTRQDGPSDGLIKIQDTISHFICLFICGVVAQHGWLSIVACILVWLICNFQSRGNLVHGRHFAWQESLLRVLPIKYTATNLSSLPMWNIHMKQANREQMNEWGSLWCVEWYGSEALRWIDQRWQQIIIQSATHGLPDVTLHLGEVNK
jgi:hypothetical protein